MLWLWTGPLLSLLRQTCAPVMLDTCRMLTGWFAFVAGPPLWQTGWQHSSHYQELEAELKQGDPKGQADGLKLMPRLCISHQV
jgi:hypothetical protein